MVVGCGLDEPFVAEDVVVPLKVLWTVPQDYEVGTGAQKIGSMAAEVRT